MWHRRRRRSNMRRWRHIWPVLIWASCIVVLGRKLLWRVVVRVIRVHVSIRNRTALLVLQALIILSPPAHILRHPLLPGRQMTTVHHAGLGGCSKPTAYRAGSGAARRCDAP